ncbi:MAG TPA: LamG domain-containing protein, partial [Polyangiaceae bacterium]|nr:LamG domain-containing protein [Polyangiaceae bacterium]
PDATSPAGARIVSKGGPGQYPFQLAYKSAYYANPEKLSWALGLTPTGARYDYSDQWLTPGQWAHVAMVYDRARVALYIDGREATPAIEHTDPLVHAPGTGLFIGALYNAKYPFKGAIDEVRIYDRALTSKEVAANACSPTVSNGGGGGGAGGAGGAGGTTGGQPSGGAAGEASSCPVVPGYVGRWSFDEGAGETARDDSVFANTGVLGSGMAARRPAWAPGKFGSALSFDGIDDVVGCGYGASLDLAGPVTIEAWIKPTAASVAGGRIVSKGRISNYPYELTYKSLYGQHKETVGWAFNFNQTGAKYGNTNEWLVPNEWAHVALVYDLTSIRLFINGAPATPAVPHTEELQRSPYGSLLIGSHDNGTFPFQGLIDEVRVYDRALSPAEVATNAQCAGRPGTVGQACQDSSQCDAGAVCGRANGGYFGLAAAQDACWAPACEDAGFRMQHCGTSGALCGACRCVGCPSDEDLLAAARGSADNPGPAAPPPPLGGTGTTAVSSVRDFIEWTLQSRSSQVLDGRAVIATAAGNSDVANALIAEVNVEQGSLVRNLIVVGILGELKSPEGEAFMRFLVDRPVPPGAATSREVLRLTAVQAKAVDGLAFSRSLGAKRKLLQVAAAHASRLVRFEAMRAYLDRFGPEAKNDLLGVVRPEEQLFLDGFYHRSELKNDLSFDQKLTQYLVTHPGGGVP